MSWSSLRSLSPSGPASSGAYDATKRTQNPERAPSVPKIPETASSVPEIPVAGTEPPEISVAQQPVPQSVQPSQNQIVNPLVEQATAAPMEHSIFE
jgi:hypothetical protein